MKLMELRQGECDYRNSQRQDDSDRRSSRHASFDGGRQPRYHKMNTRRKKQFIQAIVHHGNVDEFNEMLNDMKREAENKNRDDDYYQSASRRKGADGSVCMTIVPVFRAMGTFREDQSTLNSIVYVHTQARY